MNVKDVYMDSICFEESSLAHYIHHLLAEKKISLEDDATKLDFNLADHKKVAEMIRKNVLGFHKICIYSLKMDQKTFVFIYASSEEEAIQFYTESFHQLPLNCHKYSLDFQLARGNDTISFREMRKEFTSFPTIAGYFTKGW